MATKVKIDCDKCELGLAGAPCSFDKCKSFLPLGWEDMVYVNGEWFKCMFVLRPGRKKKTVVHHGGDSGHL